MEKIASPQDLQAELRRLLAYSETEKPSRSKLAAELRGLADKVAGIRPGTPVEVLKIWARGADPAWRGGYTYVRPDGRGTSIVRQEKGTFAGTETRYNDSDIRPARR